MAQGALKEELQLLELAVIRRTAALSTDFDKLEDKDAAQIASGIAVRRRDKTYVFTAAHFVSGDIADRFDVVFPREDFNLPSQPLTEPFPKVFSGEVIRSQRMTPRTVIRCDSGMEDTAALEIDARELPAWVKPYDLPDVPPTPPQSGDMVYFAGFPESHSPVVVNPATGEGGLARGLVTLFSQVQTPPASQVWIDEDGNERFDPSLHFIATFDPVQMKGAENFRPEGMSGCGVWRRRKGKIWTNDSELVGIQVSKRRFEVKFNRLDNLLKSLP